jgi:hypothetical protein
MLKAIVLFVPLLIGFCMGQQQQNLRKPGGRRRPMIRDTAQANSFTVAYPMDILTDTGNHFEKDWRATAHKDSRLEADSEDGKPYAYYAKAQDQEDIWLYENWFYGMKGWMHFYGVPCSVKW